MKNIYEYGSYTIGSNAQVLETRLANVIKLRLRMRGQSGQQLSYTLDELRDLESKLVLITGKDSSEKGEVYQFINVSIYTLWNDVHTFRCMKSYFFHLDLPYGLPNFRIINKLATAW